MAYYAALASLVQLLDNIILHDRYPIFLLGKHQDIKSLHKKFTFILQESLQDYSTMGDEANDRVEGRIRDVAQKAQDIIEFEISNQIYSAEGTNNEVEQGMDSIIEELQEVEQEADAVVEEMIAIMERRRSEDTKLNWHSPTFPTIGISPTTQNIVVGFDEDLITIKDQLYDQSPHKRKLLVISIVGMSGIGKTTLARKVFEEAALHNKNHFDSRVWMTISQNYNAKAVFQSILRSLNLLTDELSRAEEQEQGLLIYKWLKGRRYLVVVDDIWDIDVWDDVLWIFPEDGNGSRIILTTRLLDVARYAIHPSGFLHEMKLLNEDASWDLLQKKVFAQERCPPELENIGMVIATKCHGLPLALVVIAGILSKFKTFHDWKKIAENMGTTLSEMISSILSLSYNHLPHQLKACFLYMGSFPEDEEIDISHLIKLWVAEGFLKSDNTSRFLENVAEECVEDLVKRNLVRITKKRSNGKFKQCVLHDVVRDYCRQRAFHENFFHVELAEGYLQPRGVHKIRHINYDLSSPLCNNPQCNSSDPCGHYRCNNIGKHVRTIHIFSKASRKFSFESFEWDELRLLRVFTSVGLGDYSKPVPDAIIQLSHLKYFSLKSIQYSSFNGVSSIFLLQHLQTLIIPRAQNAPDLNLPPEIWKMSQLRHVLIGNVKLPCIPKDSDIVPISNLGNLQTLERLHHFVFTKDAIEMIPNLRKLKIRCCYDFNNLVHLRHLEELKIEFVSPSHPNPFSSNFSFSVNLKKLYLHYCYIPWKDMTMVGSLPNLLVLKLGLCSFVGEEWEPNEGEFRRLRFLQFSGLELKNWEAECTHFPRLEYLRIKFCHNLEMIPLEIGDIPTLKVIDVHVLIIERPQSQCLVDSAVSIRDVQLDNGNDELQVRIRTDSDMIPQEKVDIWNYHHTASDPTI